MQTRQDHAQDKNEVIISFIIPVYDLSAQMLHECIESIMALTLKASEREIIVVDDGSSSPAILQLQEYSDDIIYIRQKNGGLGSARNLGLRMATGMYIQFVDGDDLLLFSQYEHCIDITRFQNHPDMVVFDFSRTLPVGTSYIDQPPIGGIEYLRHHNIKASACSYLFKRSILGNLRFTQGVFHEDEEFTPLLMIRAERLILTDAKAYYYREREMSITTTKSVRTTLKRLNDFKSIIYRLSFMADRMPSSKRMAMKRRIAQITMDYIYKVIIDTRSKHYLNRQIKELTSKGLFPLPDLSYTKKYDWFRRLSQSPIGLSILFQFLPLMKRER